nr:ABC transporter permease [Ammoniphilus resinae]
MIILVLGVILSISSPVFLTTQNLLSVLLGLSVEAIIAAGMTVLMVAGGFDLSIGSVVAFVGAVTAMALRAGASVPLAILLGIVVGAAVGLLNGFIIAKLKINPFITTLGTMQAVRGLVLIVTGGRNISGLPESFTILGQGKLFGVQSLIIVMLLVIIIGDIFLRKSRALRQTYYIGSSEKAAILSGINVNKVKIWIYVLSGVLAALAGILMTARLGSASVTAGTGMEFRVITAVIIGGASLQGGEGSVFGAFLGCLLMALITNGMNLVGIDVYWQNFVVGATLLVAVIIDQYTMKRKERASLKTKPGPATSTSGTTTSSTPS